MLGERGYGCDCMRLQAVAADPDAGNRSAVSCVMVEVDNAQPTRGSRVTQACQDEWCNGEV